MGTHSIKIKKNLKLIRKKLVGKENKHPEFELKFGCIHNVYSHKTNIKLAIVYELSK